MLWVKAFHIIAVICWFAGLFYLPRLFVYHSNAHDEISNARFKIMERKLYMGIMVPSAIITIILGVWLSVYHWPAIKSAGWFHAKIAFVLLLIGYHTLCHYYLKKFADDLNTRNHIYFRWFNEAPTLLLLVIVILVVVQPF